MIMILLLLAGVSGLFLRATAVVIQSSHSCTPRTSYVPQELMPRQSRAAVVLRGESFRWGQQYSREVSRNSDLQLEATRSQIKLLVEPLEDNGLKTDVFMATYKTQFVHKLLNAWGTRLKAYRLSKRPGSQEQSVWDAVSLAWSYMKKQSAMYRFVVVMRHDMVLKQDLARLFVNNAGMDRRFLMPFRISEDLLFGVPDRVPDTLQVMPGEHFGCFVAMLDHGKFWPGEGIWRAMLKQLDGRSEDMAIITNWYGDSDPAKFQNPLYGFVQREDGPVAPDMVSTKSVPKALVKIWIFSSLGLVLLCVLAWTAIALSKQKGLR